jgi:1-acyl-sn-glycerol-3-phosphate acyltransferase
MRPFLKFIIFIFYCLIYVAGSICIQFTCKYLLRQNHYQIRSHLALWISNISRRVLKLMGVNIHVYKEGYINLDDVYLAASNHLGYLDVLILASYLPSCFVTSYEVKEMPFLGALTELGGCLYVERRNKTNLKGEISELKNALLNEINVGIFPEATSTNGSSILRFRRPLFVSAIESQTDVLPITINYKSIDGIKIDTSNRDDVCWYGDMNFLPHFWKLLNRQEINVDIHLSQPIVSHGHDAQSLSELAYQAVVSNYIPIIESSEIRVTSASLDLSPELQHQQHFYNA